MNVAVIPARGGSKRIPGKNVKPFAGKPMLAWSILAAKASGLFERIIVSTDADNIAQTALEYGAEVPFMRPATLSDDLTPTAPVFFHALDWVARQGSIPNYACCIYPTALRRTRGTLGDNLRLPHPARLQAGKQWQRGLQLAGA